MRMKHVLVAAFTLISAAALASAQEDNYIVARDDFIAKFNPPGDPVAPSDAVSKEEEGARADLRKQLQALIGPLNVRGFSGEGAYNVGSLFRGDIEFGTLDGLTFEAKDAQLVVTTDGLLERWVKSRDGLGVEDGAQPPSDAQAALRLDTFYTRAMSTDAAVSNYGDLPVTTPSNAGFVHAMLAARRQDFGPVAPDEIVIGMIAAQRAYVLSLPLDAKLTMIPACEALWTDANAKADKMFEQSPTPEDREKIADEVDRVREQGDAAMRACFGERIKADPAFARLTRQAQDWADRLAGK